MDSRLFKFLTSNTNKFIKLGSASSSAPLIIQDSIISYLDAADSNSYSGSGTNWNDLSNANNDGTLVNSPAYSSSIGYFSFNGSNQYATLPANFFNHDAGTPMTVMVWFKTSVNGGVIFGQQDTNTVNNASGWVPAIYVDTSGYIRTSCFWGGSTGNQQVSASTVSDSRWHMVAVTFASGVQKSYLDDNAFGGSLNKTQTSYSPTYYYYLGSGRYAGWTNVGASPFFNGSLSAFCFYNRELTPFEIKHNYNALRGRFGI